MKISGEAERIFTFYITQVEIISIVKCSLPTAGGSMGGAGGHGRHPNTWPSLVP